MSRWSVLALLAVLGAGQMSTATAQWAWRAKDQQITYSDRPPPADVLDENILQRPNQSSVGVVLKPAPADSAAPLRADQSLEAKRKETANKEAAKEAARKKSEAERIAKSNLENCELTRNHIKALENGIRITSTNAKGELEIMDDAMRDKEMKRTRQNLLTHCQ